MQVFAKKHVALSLLIAGLAMKTVLAPANAVEITFACANALQSSMQELIPEFERASGHKVKISYGNIGVNTERVRKGEAVDLAIVSPAQWDALSKESKVDGSARLVLGKVGIAGFVSKGAPKGDISSVDGFKRTVLSARSIALGDPAQGSPVGAHLIPVFDRLGIANEVKPKLKLTAGGPGSFQAVIKREAELSFSQLTEVVAEQQVDNLGLLPGEIQNFTAFVTAVPQGAKQAAAAKSLMEFLNSPKANSLFRAKGLDAS